MRRQTFAVLAGFMGLATAGHATRGDDLFQVVATGTTNTVSVGSSSVLSLSQDLTNNASKFSVFKNQPFTATLDYAGIKQAITFTQTINGSGQRDFRLQVPIAGVDKTFSEASGNIKDQVVKFLKSEGLADLATFQARVNQESLAGVVDGNPMANTALIADLGYQQFALHRSPFELSGTGYNTAAGHWETRVWLQGGILNADGASGQYANIFSSTEVHFNEYLGLAFAGGVGWRHIHNANIYMGAGLIGLPITFIPAKGENSLSWTLTPAGHSGVVGSPDFVSGGIIYGAQIDNSLSYHASGGLTITMANQAGYYKGGGIDVAGYSFKTQLDQWVFKNGLQATQAFGNFFIDANATWTNFLRQAFVDGYLTPGLGVGVRFGKNDCSGFRVGYSGDFGNHYTTHGVNVLLFSTY